MKLFTIGDSISQGFMSLAAAKTNLAYSTLVARSMGLESGTGYRYPSWGEPTQNVGGLPIDLESACRSIVQYGPNIRGPEWLKVTRTIDDVVDDTRKHYESGPGAAHVPYHETTPNAGGGTEGIQYFHNVAVWGFDVADSWLVTPALCQEKIAESGGSRSFLTPNAALYRTALKVLNPSLADEYMQHSQLEWLKEHATNEDEGVENLLLWLGANNALGTVVGLRIKQTPNDPANPPHRMSHQDREEAGWTLWHPADFEAEYVELLDRVDEAMSQNKVHSDWKVFVGTVPPVTIAPLAKGVGPTYQVRRQNAITGADETYVYYKYYVYFLFEEDLVHRNDGLYLTFEDVLHIDDCIRKYNATIRTLVEAKNVNHRNNGHQGDRYHIVDIFQAFQDIAVKRNAGQVKYEFPEYFDFAYPKVDTRYYHADRDGRLRRGGLSGLDGVHPTAIGQGLIAYEFLKVMQAAGVVDGINLNWEEIFERDTLYSNPINIMQEIYEHSWLAEKILTLIRTFRRSRN